MKDTELAEFLKENGFKFSGYKYDEDTGERIVTYTLNLIEEDNGDQN